MAFPGDDRRSDDAGRFRRSSWQEIAAGDIPAAAAGKRKLEYESALLREGTQIQFHPRDYVSLAKWTRERGNEILDKGVAFLQHIEDNVPILREALDDPRNDQPFIANFLMKLAPAVDMELNEEYQDSAILGA